MIILDEQLLGRRIETMVGRWYRGRVIFVNDLRPGSVIKDESIPTLLATQSQPIFVTINVIDFWNRVAPNDRYCVVCMALPDSRTAEVPDLLRQLLRHTEFRSKQSRRGKIIRISGGTATFYSRTDSQQRTIIL